MKPLSLSESIARSVVHLLILAAIAGSAEAAPPRIIAGETPTIAGRPAFVWMPPAELRSDPQPWIMYAPTLPQYPDKYEKWMHEQLLAAGVAVAGIDSGEAYGSPTGQAHMSALYEELVGNRGFAPKPCLLGRSRGGLFVSSWAIANPDKVAGIAGIYPVFDLRSYPGLKKAAPAYGMTTDELQSSLAVNNPIERSVELAAAGIPIYLVHGDSDRLVPIEPNSARVYRQYEDAGAAGSATLVVAEGQGHNLWSGFFRNKVLIRFAIEKAKAGSATP